MTPRKMKRRMWAVFAPGGELIVTSFEETKRDAIAAWIGPEYWAMNAKAGYTCRPLSVTWTAPRAARRTRKKGK